MSKLRIATDGACSGNPGPGGWAVIVALEEGIKEYSGYDLETTNNRMELRAVIEAIKLLTTKKNSNKYGEIEIRSDSAYVINTITLGWIDKWKASNWLTATKECVKNRDMLEELEEVINKSKELGINITFVKVKGHSGNVMNELADELARKESGVAKKMKEE